MKNIIPFVRSSNASALSAEETHGRIVSELDGLQAEAEDVLSRCKEMTPSAFEIRRNRRIDDSQPEGFEVNEYSNTDQVLMSNADIECIRGKFQPDEITNTLAIYPKNSDLP